MSNATGTTHSPADADVEAIAQSLLADVQRRPRDLEIRRRLATLYRSAGWRFDEARQWSAVLRDDPSDTTAKQRLDQLGPILDVIDEAAGANPPNVRLSIHRRWVVIAIHGVASPCTDEGPSGHFQQQHAYIKRLLDCGYTGFIVDLSHVTFLGSHFLGALVMWSRSVARRGGRFIICGLRPELRNVLRVTQLTRVVRCCDTLERALTLAETPPAAD